MARARSPLPVTSEIRRGKRIVRLGKSIASVCSVRPMPGAPVSTPLRWGEVKQSLDPTSFTMDAVLRRIRRHGDLYAGVRKTRQRLPA